MLDLSKKFPQWEPGKSFIVKVIYHIQEIFYNSSYLYEKDSFNKDIVKNFTSQESKYDEELQRITKTAYEERFELKNENSSLKFSQFNKYHQLILDKILKQNKDVNTFDRIEDFKNWFMNNFMEIIQNNENQK
jgi:hypothetical protein